jgi:hypothetical protein
MLRKMSDNFLLSACAEFSARKTDYFRPSQGTETGSGALLASYSMGKGISNPPCAFMSRKRTALLLARWASWKETANAFCPCLELGVFVKFDGLPCQVPGTLLPAEQDYDIIGVLFNAATFRIGSGWSPSAAVLNKYTPLLTIKRRKILV